MKKLLLIVSVAGMLFGCVKEYSPVVSNESSHTVTFTLTTGYRTQKDLILEPNTHYVHDPMPDSLDHSIKKYEPKDTVSLTCSGDTYTFFDTPPVPEP